MKTPIFWKNIHMPEFRTERDVCDDDELRRSAGCWVWMAAVSALGSFGLAVYFFWRMSLELVR